MTHLIMLAAAMSLDPIAAYLVQNTPDGWTVDRYVVLPEPRVDGLTLVFFYGIGHFDGTTNDFKFGAYALVPIPPTPSELRVEAIK